MDFDSIDEKTAFKMGFAARCFEMGLEPEQVKEAFEKSALLPTFLGGTGTGLLARFAPALAARLAPIAARTGAATKTVGTAGILASPFLLNGGLSAAKDLGLAGIGIGGAAGLLGGAALGYGKAKLDEEPIDEDEIKSKELSDTYKVYSDRLKAQKAYKKYRQARETSR